MANNGLKGKKISEGIYLTTLNDEKYKRSIISVNFLIEGNREMATDFAILPHVLERRCKKYPDTLGLSRYLYSLYGADIQSDTATVGANRLLTFSVSGIKNEYALNKENLAKTYADLLCRFVFEPYLENGAFSFEDVEIEKDKQEDYLKSEMNDKGSYCSKQARRKLYGSMPSGIESAGYLDDIPNVNPATLYNAYMHMLASGHVEILISGMEEEAAHLVAEKVMEYRKSFKPFIGPVAVINEKPFEQFEEKIDTAQCKISILAPSGKKWDAHTDAVTRLAVAIFGGLPTSRLFMNVREKQSLCYYCSAHYAPFSGVMAINSGVEHENLALAVKAIYKELEIMQTELISEEELANAVKMLENAYSALGDTPDALLSWTFNEKLKGSLRSVQEVVNEIKTVTREEIMFAMAAFKPAVQYAIVSDNN